MRDFAQILPKHLHQCSTWDGFLYTAGKTLVDSKDWFELKLLPLPCPWLEVILWPNILATGSFHWFRCACSAFAEKPEEIKRRPLWTLGSKTWQHGIVWGFQSFAGDIGPVDCTRHRILGDTINTKSDLTILIRTLALIHPAKRSSSFVRMKRAVSSLGWKV